MDVQDGFYESCAVDDEVIMEDATTSKMNSMPVSQIIMDARIFLGSTCRKYGKEKALKESSIGSLFSPSLPLDAARRP